MWPLTVVPESWMRPPGYVSGYCSKSHSKPSVFAVRVAVCPAPSPATDVLRQKRRFLYVSGTVIVPAVCSQLICPDSAFSGWQPSSGGENEQPSRHSPVHMFGNGSHLPLHTFSPSVPSL